MTDKELLELAAKAAGIEYFWTANGNLVATAEDGKQWNPLTDDGDALRLAVKLDIAIVPYPIYERPKHSVIAKQYKDSRAVYRDERKSIEEIELHNDDPYAATRRAIVRAAAEIGMVK